MKAAIVTDNGLAIADVPRPEPAPNEVLVRVRAAGLNRAELSMAAGHRHGALGGPGAVIGLEWSGDVVKIGDAVPPTAGLEIGQRVMCSGNGGYAEYAVTDWGRVSPIPSDTMDYATAATLPIALQTMHDALVTNGRLTAGESVLIQGASSGVGLVGLQVAKLLGAGIVMGSSRNPAWRARLAEFGCDVAIDTTDPRWPETVRAASEGEQGVHLIIDFISASVAQGNMEAARVLGRIINVGRLGGMRGEFDFDLHASKRIDYVGVTFRTRSLDEVREINRRMRADLWPAVSSGKIRLPIDRTFPLDQASAAQAHMRANAHLGKIVLLVA